MSHHAYGSNMEDYLTCAIDIGANMLVSGAEIFRTEDTIARICKAYGAEQVDVFSMTYVIVVTVRGEKFGNYTQSRRISHFSTNLDKVAALNNLSRKICSTPVRADKIQEEIEEIHHRATYSAFIKALSYAIISAAFTFFFDGHWMDALISATIGIVMCYFERFMQRIKVHRLMSIAATAFLAGSLSIGAVAHGLGYSSKIISTGNMMILVTGLLFTNSVRDMFMDNILSGGIRFLEAILIVLAIGLGFSLSTFVWGQAWML